MSSIFSYDRLSYPIFDIVMVDKPRLYDLIVVNLRSEGEFP